MLSEQPFSLNKRSPPAAVVLYNPDAVLLAPLLTILSQDGHSLFLFVNGQIDEASDRLIAALDDALVIRSPENQGQGFALNRLVEAARDGGASQILLMDQDSSPQPGLAAALDEVLAKHRAEGRNLAVIGPRLIPPGKESYRRLRYVWRNETEGTVFFAPTSGSLLSIAAWNDVGPFRADFFIDGIDVEWGLRAYGKGYDSAVAWGVTLEHRWGVPTAASGANRPQILRYPPMRCFFYIRNNVAVLKGAHIPLAWKVKAGLRLAVQMGLLLATRRFGRGASKLVRQAVSDGWRGRLGGAPSEVMAMNW